MCESEFAMASNDMQHATIGKLLTSLRDMGRHRTTTLTHSGSFFCTPGTQQNAELVSLNGLTTRDIDLVRDAELFPRTLSHHTPQFSRTTLGHTPPLLRN